MSARGHGRRRAHGHEMPVQALPAAGAADRPSARSAASTLARAGRAPLRLAAARLAAVLPARAACAALAAALAMHPVVAPAAASPPQPSGTAAGDAARESALARDNATGPLLDREQLRRCLYEQLRLSAETDSLAEAGRALEAERAAIARLGVELKSRAERLDRGDRSAVDAHNAQAEARNASIARHEAAVAKVEERMRTIEPARLAWSRDCANRPFRQEDRDAISSGQ